MEALSFVCYLTFMIYRSFNHLLLEQLQILLDENQITRSNIHGN
jgi:hypothetical protein